MDPGMSSESMTSSNMSSESPCHQECPPGFLIGDSTCFLLLPYHSSSYQSSLSYCMSSPHQSLASLSQIHEDIPLLKTSSSQKGVNWIFSNGFGSRMERIEKRAHVYSIYEQTLVSAPIVITVGISEEFQNISTLCVLPKYCNQPTCDIQQLLLTNSYTSLFSLGSAPSKLRPKETTSLTCLPTNKIYQVTCGSLGTIYPHPSMIDCQRTTTFDERIKSEQDALIPSCAKAYQRGTASCVTSGTSYRATCKPGWAMATCWYTPDYCSQGYCSEHGKCVSEVGRKVCQCDYGWGGDRCEFNLRERYGKVWTFPVATGVIIAMGGVVVRIVKAWVALERIKEEDQDPQSTHQTLRSYCMFIAGVLVVFYSNPGLTNISQTACRFNFIAVHFSFLLAMVQWLLEAWNVNQILRCVHLNEWETDWNGTRSWGVRIVPRMVTSITVVVLALLITFQAGWNRLAAPWTCVGVIRQETLSIWIPIFGMVICVMLFAGAVCESSLLIKFRRPLLGYRLDLKIERDLGHMEGARVEKCRRNEVLCMVGMSLLVVLWLLTILSADYKDDAKIGSLTVLIALIYSVFSFYQEAVTCPENHAMWTTLLQRYLPLRFAPSYNPETMWTIDEVRDMYKLSKEERRLRYREYIPRNQLLHLHHRWDLRFNEILEKNNMTINEALVKVFCEEMNRLKEFNGTIRQKEYIQTAYKDFLSSIPDIVPHGRVKGRLELVTLAAEAPIGVKLAKFFIVPGFDIFVPDVPEKEDSESLLNERIRMENYRLMRESVRQQAVFINSCIHFNYFGNQVVR